MNYFTTWRWALPVLVLAWGRASAAEPDPAPTRFGIRVMAASPRQDLRDLDSRTALGAGLFAETAVGLDWVAQTRFDFLDFPQTNRPDGAAIAGYTTPSPLTLEVGSVSLGVDMRHPLARSGPLRNGFGLAGLTAVRYEFESSSASTRIDQNGIPIPGIIRHKDKTQVRLGLSLGVGFEIRPGLALAERCTFAAIGGLTFATLDKRIS